MQGSLSTGPMIQRLCRFKKKEKTKKKEREEKYILSSSSWSIYIRIYTVALRGDRGDHSFMHAFSECNVHARTCVRSRAHFYYISTLLNLHSSSFDVPMKFIIQPLSYLDWQKKRIFEMFLIFQFCLTFIIFRYAVKRKIL